MTRKKAPKQKLEIVFDPKKRREFLTGFTKRKNERRKRAKEELERSLKEERKRIRQEIKEGVKHMKKTFEPLRELTEADKAEEDEYEDDDVKVKIVELTTGDLAAQRNMLGENHGEDTEESEPEQETEDEEDNANCIPGMDFDVNAKRKRKSATAESESENEDEADDNNGGNGNKKSTQKKPKFSFEDVKSKKELDHLKKTKTLKQLKKSKVFKMKERLDKKVNQKKARKDRNNTLRSIPKHLRKKKKFEKNPYSKGRKLNKKQLRKKYEK